MLKSYPEPMNKELSVSVPPEVEMKFGMLSQFSTIMQELSAHIKLLSITGICKCKPMLVGTMEYGILVGDPPVMDFDYTALQWMKYTEAQAIEHMNGVKVEESRNESALWITKTRKILQRLYRIYAHIYLVHLDHLKSCPAELITSIDYNPEARFKNSFKYLRDICVNYRCTDEALSDSLRGLKDYLLEQDYNEFNTSLENNQYDTDFKHRSSLSKKNSVNIQTESKAINNDFQTENMVYKNINPKVDLQNNNKNHITTKNENNIDKRYTLLEFSTTSKNDSKENNNTKGNKCGANDSSTIYKPNLTEKENINSSNNYSNYVINNFKVSDTSNNKIEQKKMKLTGDINLITKNQPVCEQQKNKPNIGKEIEKVKTLNDSIFIKSDFIKTNTEESQNDFYNNTIITDICDEECRAIIMNTNQEVLVQNISKLENKSSVSDMPEIYNVSLTTSGSDINNLIEGNRYELISSDKYMYKFGNNENMTKLIKNQNNRANNLLKSLDNDKSVSSDDYEVNLKTELSMACPDSEIP